MIEDKELANLKPVNNKKEARSEGPDTNMRCKSETRYTEVDLSTHTLVSGLSGPISFLLLTWSIKGRPGFIPTYPPLGVMVSSQYVINWPTSIT